jgi:hypothetical protein
MGATVWVRAAWSGLGDVLDARPRARTVFQTVRAAVLTDRAGTVGRTT